MPQIPLIFVGTFFAIFQPLADSVNVFSFIQVCVSVWSFLWLMHLSKPQDATTLSTHICALMLGIPSLLAWSSHMEGLLMGVFFLFIIIHLTGVKYVQLGIDLLWRWGVTIENAKNWNFLLLCCTLLYCMRMFVVLWYISHMLRGSVHTSPIVKTLVMESCRLGWIYRGRDLMDWVI